MTLREWIIRCELTPGGFVSETLLQERLGVGKTPVREALGRLMHEGLVRSVPRQGYYISNIALIDVRDIFGVREVIEPAIARLAAGRVEESELREIDIQCKVEYLASDADAAIRFFSANRHFHSIVARAAGNQRLCAMMERLLDESERVFFFLNHFVHRNARLIKRGHAQLIDRLVSGDAEGAASLAYEAAHANVVEAERLALEALLSNPNVLTAAIAEHPLATAV